MSFEQIVNKNRTCDVTVTILDADGDLVALAVGDVVRFKLGRGDGATPALDLDSAAASANGSSVTASNPAAVRIAQGDSASLVPGAYEAEVGIVDDSEVAPADAFKHATSGVVHIVGSLGGDVGTS